MKTYIIRTREGEYYCSKTKGNVFVRYEQHKKEKHPHWFSYKNRKDCWIEMVFDGDFEKGIKRAGIKFFIKLIKSMGYVS